MKKKNIVELEMSRQISYRSNKSLFGLLSTLNIFSNAHGQGCHKEVALSTTTFSNITIQGFGPAAYTGRAL